MIFRRFCPGEPGGSVPATRQRIENAWNAQLTDHAGASEVGPWGFSRDDRGLHIIESEFIAEFLSIATGENARDGELSELVLTRLQGTPAIQPTMQVLEGNEGLSQRIIFGFAAIFLAPLIEEILFRGILYRTGQQLGYPRLALFATSFVFAAIHGSLMTMLPLMVLSIVFSLLYDRTNRLIAPIAAHSLFNAVNFFAYLNRDALTQWVESLK